MHYRTQKCLGNNRTSTGLCSYKKYFLEKKNICRRAHVRQFVRAGLAGLQWLIYWVAVPTVCCRVSLIPAWWGRRHRLWPRIHEQKNFESFERIDSIRETSESFYSYNSWKRLIPSRLHELHESKLTFVSRIEFIRSKLSIFSAHVSGVCVAEIGHAVADGQ